MRTKQKKENQTMLTGNIELRHDNGKFFVIATFPFGQRITIEYDNYQDAKAKLDSILELARQQGMSVSEDLYGN